VIYYFSLLLTVSIFSSIAYTRYYLAAHGWDQILFGFCLGMWLAFFFTFVLRNWIISHVQRLIRKDINDTGLFVTHSSDIAWITLILGLFYLPVVISYLLVDNYFTVPQVWIDRINEKCGDRPLYESFHYKSLTDSGFVCAFWASYLGLLVSKLISEPKLSTESVGLARFLIRTFVMIIVAIPITYVQNIPTFLDPLYFIFLIRTFVPSFLYGFFLFAFSEQIFEWIERLFGLKPL
jgi:hypothetical protein